MKVVLLKDDKKYGKRGAIIEVSDGFAKNYLIPNKIATIATNTAVNEAHQQSESEKFKASELLKEAQQLNEKLKLIEVILTVKVGENGKVFGSITSKEIYEELLKQGIEIDKRKIEILTPIKTIGAFDIKVKLHPEVKSSVRVVVNAE